VNPSRTPDRPPTTAGRAAEVFAAFLRLGLVSFGGPVAHLGYFHREFVSRRAWVDEAAYADMVALCQFLPGPASSQVAFALGANRAGVLGGVAASAAFLLPSAGLMIAFAYGVSAAQGVHGVGVLHGLKLAAAAIVAHAVWSMWGKLCPDLARRGLALAAAAALLAGPGAWAQVAVIAAGGLLGWALFRRQAPAPGGTDPAPRGRAAAVGALLLFAALLVAAPLLARWTGRHEVAVFDAFYRSGALVFGGGHTVLPLLRAEVVPPGWVTDEQFLAGYGAAQAVPGPLFSFAGYLGTLMGNGGARWAAGVGCLMAIFLPAWLLIAGALPFWHGLRARAWARAGLMGANAAVVGVLLAAWITPVVTSSVRGWWDAAVVVGALALLRWLNAPTLLVVGVCAAAGWTVTTAMGR
jgi:chromate transporter